MRIGVVCEGPSDFPAVTYFFGHALRTEGIDANFIALFPDMDRTRPEGGWANVLLWLDRNPPESRIRRYFGGGLFAGALSTEPLDAILIQLDGDALESESFKNFVANNYGYEVPSSRTPTRRAAQVEKVISLAANFKGMTSVDTARHIAAPAIEATEAWCIAAFYPKTQDFELLRGAELVNAFMTVLERSEGRTPLVQYSNIDKSLPRRRRFCETHASGAHRIVKGCRQFAKTVGRLTALA